MFWKQIGEFCLVLNLALLTLLADQCYQFLFRSFFFPVDRKVFLATWKDIPAENEVQNQISNVTYSSGRTLLTSLVQGGAALKQVLYNYESSSPHYFWN